MSDAAWTKRLTALLPILFTALMMLVVEVFSLVLAPFMDASGYYAFGQEGRFNPLSTFLYILLILAFTLFLLLAIKYGWMWLIRLILLMALLSTLYYVFSAVLAAYTLWYVPISIAASLLLTVLLYVHPEWYVVDVYGVLIGAGAAAIFGVSLSVLPVVLLLLALAIYDIIAVYKTKHMLTLAEGVLSLKLPVMLVVPTKKGFSLKSMSKLGERGEREAYFMGLGDAVIPAILVVSAAVFIQAPAVLGWVNLPSLLALVGSFAGFFALMLAVRSGKPQAGLPFLNTGTLLGYAAGCLIAGVPVL
ncbi:MAG: presenilin family intramembrane aspartyl protease PSH [Methermicoccaceae archaeon]